jgi:hypothetical protein
MHLKLSPAHQCLQVNKKNIHCRAGGVTQLQYLPSKHKALGLYSSTPSTHTPKETKTKKTKQNKKTIHFRVTAVSLCSGSKESPNLGPKRSHVRRSPLSSGVFPGLLTQAPGRPLPGRTCLKRRLGLWGRGPASWQVGQAKPGLS